MVHNPENGDPASKADARIILSFDVEEHHRIEAAVGLHVEPALQARYAERVGISTRWLLDQLGQHGIRATFFLVGQLAHDEPELVKAIHRDGHELASHSWAHRRVHTMTPEAFREDLRMSIDAIEQITGEKVVGYRAPTFSVTRQTAWALDVIAEAGLLYDSSIYPVRHDRYGVPDAPRAPFLARGRARTILELPPATLRWAGLNIPVGGGGYFRLLPLRALEMGLSQARHSLEPAVSMLYFHPWEFDPVQPRLPLRPLSRFRTYTGIDRSQVRLVTLLQRHRFTRASDVARELEGAGLPVAAIGEAGPADR